LHKKTGNKVFLEMARNIGDNILANRVQRGFFLASSRHIYVKFDVLEPLVLLHLHAAIKAGDKSAPIVWPNKSLFHGPYRYRQFATDYKILYSLTESPEPPLSLEEVVAIGDVVEVKRLISQGFDVDERADNNFKTPLHRAAVKGHWDILELLLAEGADVNAGDHSGRTALHYAVSHDNRNMAYLLIVKAGADVNVKDVGGETALSVAKAKGHTEIVELLRKHRAGEADASGGSTNIPQEADKKRR
jgi:hypothetical protein